MLFFLPHDRRRGGISSSKTKTSHICSASTECFTVKPLTTTHIRLLHFSSLTPTVTLLAFGWKFYLLFVAEDDVVVVFSTDHSCIRPHFVLVLNLLDYITVVIVVIIVDIIIIIIIIFAFAHSSETTDSLCCSLNR